AGDIAGLPLHRLLADLREVADLVPHAAELPAHPDPARLARAARTHPALQPQEAARPAPLAQDVAQRGQPAARADARASHAGRPRVWPSVARWLVGTRAQPAVVRASRLPHAAVRAIARQAARWFGPTGSALVRFFSGAIAAAADHAGSLAIETRLRARVHPGLLVPHPHAVAVLALDMRGFSKLTGALEDTQYLAQLIEVYLTE